MAIHPSSAADTKADLYNVIPSDGAIYQLNGNATLGDIAPTSYRYDASSSLADNYPLVIRPTMQTGNGRFLLLNLAQLQADWGEATSSDPTFINNKPSLSAVATSGQYSDLANKPSLAAVAISGAYTDLSGKPGLAPVATSGSYNDLSNKPSIPAAQVNSDWNSISGVSQISNKPSLAAVATSGNYTDLSNTPVAAATYQATPTNPATTTNATGVMMGLAGAITPARSGKVVMMISGTIDNDTLGDGAQVQIRYGTGTAPTNGAALTGTTAGGLVKQINASLALLTPGAGPFALTAIVIGLTVSTAYWVDISLARITGGTARVRDISISLVEL